MLKRNINTSIMVRNYNLITFGYSLPFSTVVSLTVLKYNNLLLIRIPNFSRCSNYKIGNKVIKYRMLRMFF